MVQAVRAIVVNGDKLLVMHRNKFGHEYYTLVGGGIDVGEDAETALRRELHEETGLSVGTVRHVFTEDAGAPYGIQLVFLCNYQGGEPTMSSTSDEAHINQLGQNTYTPEWLPVSKLPTTQFLSESLRDALVHALAHGFPEAPKTLEWKYTPVSSLPVQREGEN